jgi:UDP-N-acetylmuramyl pentapeptide phosphotransferase/UDP-N-acetylglucosamine-1-phosphate transferase
MEAISISLALWFFTEMNLMLLLAFSVGGFLYWNWPKAKIFMGDAGSTTLGFILVVLGIHLHDNDTFSFFYWILITALFWFDATITLIRRIINKENLSQAHKNHLYQKAIQGGFSHLKALISGFGINVLLFLICFAIWNNYFTFLSGFLLALIILYLAMKYVDQKYAFRKQVNNLKT